MRFAGHHRNARAVRSGVAVPGVTETPRVRSGLSNRIAYLLQKLILNSRLTHRQSTRIARQMHCAIQLEMRESAHVIKIERVGVTRIVDIVDVILSVLGSLLQIKRRVSLRQ